MSGAKSGVDGIPIDRDLAELRRQLGEMGRWALAMLHDGVDSLGRFDAALARDVIARDDRLDQFDVEIEQTTLRLLLTRQPTAHDARCVASSAKVISYLDRIGRHGYDIAGITLNSVGGHHSEPWGVLVEMDARVEAMISESLEALALEDVQRAGDVYARDDVIDDLDRKVLRECVALSAHVSESSPGLFDYVRVSRALERAADNACKISEKAVYIATGKRRREFLDPDKHLRPIIYGTGAAPTPPSAPPTDPPAEAGGTGGSD